MKRLPLSLLAHWAGGELRGDDVVVDSMSNDTRSLVAGGLYVALRGERFDGHEFAYDAAMRGAGALMVEHPVEVDLPQLVVADGLLALAQIARSLQHDRTAKVLAVTGSNGKTGVKTLLQSILSLAGSSYVSPGNRNNEIGLPLAVIDAPDDSDFAIYEMGAGKPGDIAYLTDIVKPDVALVNNVAAAHLERLLSLQGVAETKGAIYTAMGADGVAVVNADDAFAEYFVARLEGRQVLRFGLEASAEVGARDIQADPSGSRFLLVAPQGEVKVDLPLPGRHNVANALAAASMAIACGVGLDIIAAGLSAARPVAGRQVAHALGNGSVMVDDSYNANPASMAVAIATLGAHQGPAWLVLGDMRELGNEAEAMHAEVGRSARAAGIARLYALGHLSAAAARAFGEGARSFESHAALAEAVSADLAASSGVRLLVKGSRGSAMERVVARLMPRPEPRRREGAPHAA